MSVASIVCLHWFLQAAFCLVLISGMWISGETNANRKLAERAASVFRIIRGFYGIVSQLRRVSMDVSGVFPAFVVLVDDHVTHCGKCIS